MFKIIPFLVWLACLSTFTKGDFEPLKWVYGDDQSGNSFIERTAEKIWSLVENGETLGEYNEESFKLDENGLPVVILWKFIDEDQSEMIFLLIKEGEMFYGYSKDSITESFVKGKWEITNSQDSDTRVSKAERNHASSETSQNGSELSFNNAERICTDTCEKNDLNWNGAFIAVESEKINSCECRDKKKSGQNSYTRASVKTNISMNRCIEIFCARMHDLQNEYRTRHRVNHLRTNSSLSNASQIYAAQMASSLLFQHDSTRGNVGENLAFIGRTPSPQITETYCRQNLSEVMTNLWYREVDDYNFVTGQANDPRKVIGHFTQMVWGNSTSFGCGLARDLSGQRFFAVGRYFPRGNIIGQFLNNVFPPR